MTTQNFRTDWSGLRNRLDAAFATIEKQTTYEMRSAHLDELARVFEDGISAAIHRPFLVSDQANTTVSELMACPFCGSTSLWLGEVKKPSGGDWVISGYQPWCKGCDASLPEQPSKEQAIAAWNRRATADVTEAQTRLQEALDAFDEEVSQHLAEETERADLWADIEVNAEDLRALIAALNPPMGR